MHIGEGSNQTIQVLQSLLLVAERILPLLTKLRLSRLPGARYSYENLSLNLTLDILDCKGQRALVRRSQRVRFLSEEAGVLTNPVWGQGEQVKRFQIAGARRIGSRQEGPRRILFLGLIERPTKGTVCKVLSRRLITGGFRQKREYFEAAIERPTRRFGLKVLFPKGRPPKQAALIATPGDTNERLPLRLNRDGRAVINWTTERPRPDSLFSVRWSW